MFSPRRARRRLRATRVRLSRGHYGQDSKLISIGAGPRRPGTGRQPDARPFAHLSNELCFAPDFCQKQRADAGPDDPATLPLHTALDYQGSWTTGEAQEQGATGLAAHLEYIPGIQRNTMSADADYSVPYFAVAPNTLATFTIRLHGGLSAADGAFPYLGRVFGETQFVPDDVSQWQKSYFSLQLTTQAQSFDQRIVATLRSDTPEVDNVWWYLHSGLDLQLPAPEPAAWLMLLAGLALLLPRIGAMPVSVSLQQKM